MAGPSDPHLIPSIHAGPKGVHTSVSISVYAGLSERGRPYASGKGIRLGILSVIASRVENRRSNGSLPVDIRLGFRQVTSVRFGVVLFPVPAHRTGQADFPHPALGKDSRSRPRKAGGPVW
jgi:hypothetical protein